MAPKRYALFGHLQWPCGHIDQWVQLPARVSYHYKCSMHSIDAKNIFYVFFILSCFLRLLTFFLFSNVYFILKKRWQSSERQADLQEALSK